MIYFYNWDNLCTYKFSSEISGNHNPFGGYGVTSVSCLQDKERYLFPGHSENNPGDRALFPLNLSYGFDQGYIRSYYFFPDTHNYRNWNTRHQQPLLL